MNVISTFIELIKRLREKNGLTIEHLADLAKVHRTTIGLLERHKRTPTLQMAVQISDALGVPLSELIQEAELISKGFFKEDELVERRLKRKPSVKNIRNKNKLLEITGIDSGLLLASIDSCYQVLDVIDDQLIRSGSTPVARLVELANLSSIIGNIIGGRIADNSGGLYIRNKPHSYPDLLPQASTAAALELKVALETNKPKGHLPKKGVYMTFRYVLGDKQGNYVLGRENRGDTVWIWEVKVGVLSENDFSCSNTPGDSGKTAVIKTSVHNKMYLVYYVPEHLPYTSKTSKNYVGFN